MQNIFPLCVFFVVFIQRRRANFSCGLTRFGFSTAAATLLIYLGLEKAFLVGAQLARNSGGLPGMEMVEKLSNMLCKHL